MSVAEKPHSNALFRLLITAVAHPTPQSYSRLPQAAHDHLSGPWMWLLVGSAATGCLVSAVGPAQVHSATTFVAGIVVFVMLALLMWALFAGLVHGAAKIAGGRGRYRDLFVVSAAFGAPLMVLQGLLSVIPGAWPALVVVYLYWVGLYVVAVRIVHAISAARAVPAVIVPLMIWFAGLGALLFGAMSIV
jgi:hypothetical protein